MLQITDLDKNNFTHFGFVEAACWALKIATFNACPILASRRAEGKKIKIVKQEYIAFLWGSESIWYLIEFKTHMLQCPKFICSTNCIKSKM